MNPTSDINCNCYGLFSEDSVEDGFLLHVNIPYLQLGLTDSSLSTLGRHNSQRYATLQDRHP
jgi:hypothetical protein